MMDGQRDGWFYIMRPIMHTWTCRGEHEKTQSRTSNLLLYVV